MSRLRRLIGALVTLVVIGTAAWVVWPARLGGAAVYVVVRGHSMEPTYHMGDLLYARTGGAFRPGDVAIYRIPRHHPGAGIMVVHRIKRVLPNGHYLFQGDNKKAPDDVTPARADLVAKPMADLTSLPTKFIVMAPVVFTVLTGICVTIALWPGHRHAHADEEDTDDTDADGDAEPPAAAAEDHPDRGEGSAGDSDGDGDDDRGWHRYPRPQPIREPVVPVGPARLAYPSVRSGPPTLTPRWM
ncbi:MAG: S24/S26 family peptidase [Acidimicrobiia bacterium]